MLILASQSPRRRELMGLFGLPFEIRTKEIDETLEAGISVSEAVANLSRRKAEAIERSPADIVIAADTVVVLDGQALGKPRDEADARKMLCRLSGKTHQVMTGLTVLQGERAVSCTEITQVTFGKLTQQQIDDYIRTGEPMDKAGSYGIQGKAALFVEGISGDYYNVVGLPVCRLGGILRTFMEEKE